MASTRLEAEDFRVIEPCIPCLPRHKASRGLHGMIPRLREPVDETAETRPAVAAVSYKVPDEWMLAAWP